MSSTPDPAAASASRESAPGRLVVAAYRPKPGHEQALLALVAKHWAVLDREGLVAPRAPTVMRAGDGTIVEVFEWRSAEAIDAAHGNAAVAALWREFDAACVHVPLAQLAEAQRPFADFAVVRL